MIKSMAMTLTISWIWAAKSQIKDFLGRERAFEQAVFEWSSLQSLSLSISFLLSSSLCLCRSLLSISFTSKTIFRDKGTGADKRHGTMNDLFSGSFSRRSDSTGDLEAGTLQMTGVNLDKFFEDVESVKEELREVEKLHRRLQDSNEESKTVHNAKAMKDLRARMDADVTEVLKKAKVIKVRVEALDRANASNRSLPGCGPGTSTDRTRTSVVSGLRKKLKDTMDDFQVLRGRIMSEYRETIERRYFTVTGEKPDEQTVEILISTGESETFLRKAIQEQGRGQILDAITEIQERHDSVKEMEKNLLNLHQIFLDMSVLVQAQGEQLDDIESHVARASSYVRRGTDQLQTARKHQKSTRKWTCIAIIILLVIILIIVLPIVLSNSGGGGGGGNNNGGTP